MLNKLIIYICFLLYASETFSKELEKEFLNNNGDNTVNEMKLFFYKNPQITNLLWSPLIDGRKRLKFSIPKLGFDEAYKSQDFSTLFYESQIKHERLVRHSSSQKKANLFISPNNFQFKLDYKNVSGFTGGVFFKKKQKRLFGFSVGKEFILENSSLINFDIKYNSSKNIELDTSFIKLLHSEKAEMFSLFSLNNDDKTIGEFGINLFDIQDTFDLILSSKLIDKNLTGELVIHSQNKNYDFLMGITDLNFTKNSKLFMEFRFDFLPNNKKFNTLININSSNNSRNYIRPSMKKYRLLNADKWWRRYMR